MAQQRTALCTHRHRCVTPHRSHSAHKTWWRLTRGWPQLRKGRERMEQVSPWCDRRCRTPTARETLTQLRRRLTRFQQLGDTRKKLLSPPLENARTGLADTRLLSPSHAVERGNRRDRKRPKPVYRVRTQE